MYFYAYFVLQLYRVRRVWNWIIWEKEGKNKFQTYFKPGVVSSNAARYEYIINTCLCLLPEIFCGGDVHVLASLRIINTGDDTESRE